MSDNNSISNFLWKFFERFSAQLVHFVITIVLARLLSPSDYGIIALVSIFTTISNTFIDSGMGVALVQKKNVDVLDYSSLFFFNILLGIIFYIFIFIFSSHLIHFINKDFDENVVLILKILGVKLIIYGLKNIQNAYIIKNILYKKYFYSNLIASVLSGIFAIFLAYQGKGVWALVIQSLLYDIISTIILFFVTKLQLKLSFSLNRIKELWNFGWKIFISKLIDKGYIELRVILIGKYYTSEDLAYYSKGARLPSLFIDNINNSIDGVVFPMMCKAQEDFKQIRELTRRAIIVSSYVIMPLMMGLVIIATPLIKILLTEKWLPCVFYLRVACITWTFHSINTANLNAIKAMGRSDYFLCLEVIKKIIGLILIITTIGISVKALALSSIILSVFSQIINSWPNRKFLNYKYEQQLIDIMPQFLLSLIMGGGIWFIQYMHINCYLIILFQIILGITIYIGLSYSFKVSGLSILINMLQRYKLNLKNNL